MDTVDVEVQAKHALMGHVRTSDGRDHGRGEAYPLQFDPDELVDYIEIRDGESDETHEVMPKSGNSTSR